MSLTSQALAKLREKSFIELYDGHKPEWKELFAYTYEYVGKIVKERIRQDDVNLFLEIAIGANKHFSDFLEKKQLEQAPWTRYFCEYVTDRGFADLGDA
jgi:hypothetical protein